MQRTAQTFLEVIDANKGVIYKVANSYCRNEDNRKDLIQEIMLQLWLSFPKYDEQYRITTWMYRIALNVSISYYRKENRRDKINHPMPEAMLYLKEEDNGGEGQAAINQLYKLIRELKEIDRAIMLLYLEGSSHQEIGDILGLTTTNVSTKVARIKQQLKKNFPTYKSKVMEDVEIMNLWKSYDKRLQESLVLNRKNTEEITRMKVQSFLYSMRPIKVFTVLVGIAWVVLIDLLIINLFSIASSFFLSPWVSRYC
ncbi:sigma-70 family RNA polymerase sigma factor [Paraflavitalea speifideaquila]|uniref:RNA polymerase sigma factor n=1 Tax=Paraflavitalea speifideaquila TaxID=3076558 RepID=UPI0028E6F101|nr:sigma-70 family RNA polymerase sigma factor [Paraflavitalea speifideiaquila]